MNTRFRIRYRALKTTSATNPETSTPITPPMGMIVATKPASPRA